MEKIKDFTTKHKKLLYILAAAVIVIISCCFGLQKQENWVFEQYGATNDGAVTLKENKVYELDFETSNDNYQGTMIKMADSKSGFTDEEIVFELFEKGTGIQVSSYVLKLNETIPNSNSFIRLPMEQSKNKELKLVFYGRNIHVAPSLQFSNTSNMKSIFYIDGKKQNNTLVFSAVYNEYTYQAAKPLMVGMALIVLLIIIYYLPIVSKSIEHDEKQLKVNNIINRIINNRIIHVVTILVLIVGLSLFVYKTYIEKYIGNKEVINIVKEGDYKDIVIDNNVSFFENKILVKKNGLDSINYNLGIIDGEKNAQIRVKVIREKTASVCFDDVISISDIIKNNNTLSLYLRSEVNDSKTESFTVSIEPINFISTKMILKTNRYSKNSIASINGSIQGCSPTVFITINDMDYLYSLYIVFCILLGGIALFVYLFAIKNEGFIKKYSVFLVFLFGLVYLLLIPLYSVPDEYSHVDTSYLLSNKILGVYEKNHYGYDYKRSVDIDVDFYPDKITDLKDYRRLYYEIFSTTKDNSINKVMMKDVAFNASIVCYLPSAIGITIARFLDLGTLPMLLLGRIFSLLAYSAICWLSIKIYQKGYIMILLYSTMPIVLQESASFSYDCFINAFSILFFSLLFSFLESKDSILKFLGLIICAVFLAIVKGGVYMPLSLLVVLAFFDTAYNSRVRKKYSILILSCIMIFFASKNAVSFVNKYISGSSIKINSFSGKEIYSFGYLIANPGNTIKILINSIFKNTSRYIYEFFSGNMGALNIQMPWMYVVLFIIIIFYIACSGKKELQITRTSKIMILLASLASLVLINVALLLDHTNIDITYIQGVQGRYFIPCILPLFFILPKFIHNDNQKKGLIFYFYTQIVFLFNVIMVILV